MVAKLIRNPHSNQLLYDDMHTIMFVTKNSICISTKHMGQREFQLTKEIFSPPYE